MRVAARSLRFCDNVTPVVRIQARFRSTAGAAGAPATESLSPRWLADVKQRIGKCVTFGLSTQQTARAGAVLSTVARDWRDLVAGSEGFLTQKDRRGLYRHHVQWGEMDSMVGHVNNVIYNRYAETARVNWARNFATNIDPEHSKDWSEFWTPKGLGMILRSIKTDFKFPMTWPDHISVYHKLTSAPGPKSDSFVLDVLILSEKHQRPAARCYEDIVVYDYKAGKKAPLKPFMVDEFVKTWELQQEAKEKNSQRVRGLLEEVRALETESWDRADAVEDLGSATGQ